MRSRYRRARRRGRFEELVLDLRTARWLGMRLWRPTLMQLVTRPARRRRRRARKRLPATLATMRPGR